MFLIIDISNWAIDGWVGRWTWVDGFVTMSRLNKLVDVGTLPPTPEPKNITRNYYFWVKGVALLIQPWLMVDWLKESTIKWSLTEWGCNFHRTKLGDRSLWPELEGLEIWMGRWITKLPRPRGLEILMGWGIVVWPKPGGSKIWMGW